MFLLFYVSSVTFCAIYFRLLRISQFRLWNDLYCVRWGTEMTYIVSGGALKWPILCQVGRWNDLYCVRWGAELHSLTLFLSFPELCIRITFTCSLISRFQLCNTLLLKGRCILFTQKVPLNWLSFWQYWWDVGSLNLLDKATQQHTVSLPSVPFNSRPCTLSPHVPVDRLCYVPAVWWCAYGKRERRLIRGNCLFFGLLCCI